MAKQDCEELGPEESADPVGGANALSEQLLKADEAPLSECGRWPCRHRVPVCDSRPRKFEMADDLQAGVVLEPDAMVPPRPELAAEEEPASWKEGEHLSPRRRAVRWLPPGLASLRTRSLLGEWCAGLGPSLTLRPLTQLPERRGWVWADIPQMEGTQGALHSSIC